MCAAFLAVAKKGKSRPPAWQKAAERGAKEPLGRSEHASLGQEALEGLLEEWTEIQRQACEAQVALLRNLFDAHSSKLEDLLADGCAPGAESGPAVSPAALAADAPRDPPKTLEASAANVRRPSSPPLPPLHVDADAGDVPGDDDVAPSAPWQPPTEKDMEDHTSAQASCQVDVELVDHGLSEDFAQQLEDLEQSEDLLNMWRRGSGLHTVEKWCSNFKKHPAGWGALLMIHGIPEVTGRLRSKVENYAIYSALFLSVSMAWLADPPSHMKESCEPLDGYFFWECELQKRAFAYLLALGTGAHMLSILLAMTFINVLNEAARDSDVIRMFARGKGFLATVKVQYSFRLGCIADFASMLLAAKAWVGWDMFVLAIGIASIMCVYFRRTAGLLWRNGGIVAYWRAELGGKPDADDPYELEVPLSCLVNRAKVFRSFQEAAKRQSNGAA